MIPTSTQDSLGRRYAFLVNPVSGSGKGRSVFEALPSCLESLGISAGSWSRELTGRGDVSEQACRLLESNDRLIVAGGDGTMGQAMEGLRRSQNPQAALGLIPLGTGNDLARELDLLKVFEHRGLKGLLESLLQDRVVPLDLWNVGPSSVMANYLSIGTDGWITETFAQRRDLSESHHSVLANKVRFARAGLQCLRRRLPPDFRVSMTLADGTRLDRAFSGCRAFLALNIGSYASGILHAHRTRSDDGLLTAMAVPRLWHYAALASSGSVRALHNLVQRSMPRWQVRSFEATWSGPTALQIDGEGRSDLVAQGNLSVDHGGRVRLLSGTTRP